MTRLKCCLIGSDHAELTRQIKEARDENLRDDLERELDGLVERMEIKGNQITKLRRLHGTVSWSISAFSLMTITSSPSVSSNESHLQLSVDRTTSNVKLLMYHTLFDSRKQCACFF